MNISTKLIAGLAVGITCAAASAQAQQAASNAASQPSTIGVTPETAKAANVQAVPRSDTATVVRTGPTVTDKASQMKSSANDALATDGTTVAANGTNGPAMRAPRADRN
ncbi:hypothetical protein ACTJKJ_24640 [Roseateles sp. 22389]|uniref:hypothetical protein n=1 Tax=Roseateles sp. 22389 TaxID=3453916 RepID=UPI003F86B697